MDINIKSVGILIDELCTTSQKLWHMQEIVEDTNASDKDIANAFRNIQHLNVRRNLLINAIDERLNPEVFSTTIKTYK